MVARDEAKLVLWPHYFDKSLTRAQGRRVAADLAVEAPKAGSIAQAARTLGMKVTLEEEARPPRHWYKARGRVLVEKVAGSKEDVLRQIARRL